MESTLNNKLTLEQKRALLKARLAGKKPTAKVQVDVIKAQPKTTAGQPLSFAQQRLWLLDSMAGGSSHYNIAASLRLTGKLDVAAMARAFTGIVERHEVLRTRFDTDEQGRPRQYVQAEAEVKIVKATMAELEKAASEPFDLTKGSLLRLKLAALADEEHVLLLVMHHIISDGWSMGLLIAEFSKLYRACTQGWSENLSPLSIQYRDYACWQRAQLQGHSKQEQLDFWQQQLAGMPLVHRLPLDKPRPQEQTFNGAQVDLELPKALLEKLNDACSQCGATLFMGLQAAFSGFLARYSNETDIVMGTPVANREQPQVADLLGFFVNTLVLRSDLSHNPGFNALLEQSKKCLMAAFKHQQLPFELVVERLNPKRDLSYSPLFQVMLVVQNGDDAKVSLPGLEVSSVSGQSTVAKFELTLTVTTKANGGTLSWEYNSDLFERKTIETMAVHFNNLLANMLATPDVGVLAVPMLTDEEVKQQVIDFNANQKGQLPWQCAHQPFEAQVLQTPQLLAVEFEDKSLTYAELNCRANRLARYLITQRQVKPQMPVGICLPRGLEFVVSFMAVLKAGCAFVPLDPTYPAARLKYMLEDAALNTVICDTQTQHNTPINSAQAVLIDEQTLNQQLLKLDQSNIDLASAGIDGESLAYIIYTSGSTGQPKGVMIEHQSLLNMNCHEVADHLFEVGSRVLHIYSFSFDAAMSYVFAPLNVGATIVISDGHRDLSQFMADKGITQAVMPAALLAAQNYRDLPALKMVGTGGEHLPEDVAEQWVRSRRYVNIYGPTEATVTTTRAVHDGALGEHNMGYPIPNVQCYVLNGYGQPVPVGHEGELHIGGIQVARGYHNKAQLTAEKFIDLPAQLDLNGRGGKLYKSGDLVRFNHKGQLQYIGRIDNQIKLRGFRIELGEIEHTLAQHLSVNLAAVVLHQFDDGNKQLVAYITLHRDELDTGLLKAYLKAQLPAHMVPAQILVLAQMPFTPNGKVDKKALPSPTAVVKDHFVAPQDQTEQQLAQIFAELLNRQGPLSRDGDFFELGGHSLLTVRLLARLRQQFDVELDIKTIFAKPTVAQLAEALQSGVKTQKAKAIAVVARDQGPLKASFAQKRLWFIDQMAGGSAFYNMSSAFRVEGAFDITAATAALTELVARHEVLRTRFIKEGEVLLQQIHPATPFVLEQVDLTIFSGAAQTAELEQRLAQKHRHQFDLTSDPLLLVSYFNLSPDHGAILFNIHHIAGDGWSMTILLKEFKQLYQAYVNGQSPQLPASPLQYVDYAQWQYTDEYAQLIDRQMAYWRTQLQGIPQCHSLPLDFARPSQPRHRGARVTKKLDAQLTQALKQLAKAHKLTLFMLLHGAFSAVLARHSNNRDIVIGTAVANRQRLEFEDMVGCFINTLVLRLNCRGEQSINGFFEQVKQVNLEAQDHQDVAFEQLVEQLNPSRDTACSPLFQVMFTMNTNDRQSMSLPGVQFDALEPKAVAAKYDLTLNAIDSGERLELTFEYDRDLFKPSRMDTLAEHLALWLGGLAVQFDQGQLAQMPLLSEQEQHHLRFELNDTAQPFDQHQGIHQLFERQVQNNPDAIALEFEQNQLSYGQLNDKANRLAALLIDQGVVRDTLVGVCLPRGEDLVISVLAVLKAGGAFVPLDPEYPQQRLKHMHTDAGISKLLTHTALTTLLASYQGKTVLLDDPQTHRLLQYQPCANVTPAEPLDAGALAYVIYTSGSTGLPKGVAVEHRGLVNLNQFEIEAFDVTPNSRVLHVVSFSFDPAMSHLFFALNAGATVVLSDTKRDLTALMKDQRITHAIMPPAVLSAQKFIPLPDLKVIGTGGEHCPRALAEQWAKGRRYFNVYGPTETTITATQSEHVDTIGNHAMGKPIANVQCYILDPDRQLVPKGAEGELYIGGAGLARGYLHQPEMTAQRFVDCPWSGGQKLYRTGDLVRHCPDGQIEYLGRIDEQVKIRGFRIELGEIAQTLADCDDVEQAVVIVHQVSESLKQLLAYVTLAPEQKETPDKAIRLKAQLAQKLPQHMVPAHISVLDTIPFNTNGKVDKKALPLPQLTQTQAHLVAPESDTEKALAKIFSQLLKLGHDAIGVGANFFELGGHSLLCVQLTAQINQQFGVELAVKDVFEQPLLCQLAKTIDNSAKAVGKAPIALPRTGEPMATSFGQKRLWFLHQMQVDSSQYNMAGAFDLRGAFDQNIAAKAFNHLIARHEILRTVYQSGPEGPLQLPQEQFEFALPLQDISQLPAERQKAVVQKAMAQDRLKPFDLGAELMLRCELFKLSPQHHVLLLNLHHIAADGWSMAILTEEFGQSYAALSQGRQPELKPLAVQYADFAAWQNSLLQNNHRALEHWLTKLDAIPGVHSLPLDKPRYDSSQSRKPGAEHSCLLSAPLSDKLRQLSQAQGTTLFMTLQAAFAVHLARWSNERDILMGAPTAGREHLSLQNLMGLFLNTQVFRTRLTQQQSFIELLAATKEQHLADSEFNAVPFDLLVEKLNPPRSTLHSPVFQVMINMNNTPKGEFSVAGLNIGHYGEDAPFDNKYDLTLYINEQGADKRVRFDWAYDSGLFNDASIAMAAAEFTTLLESLICSPERPVLSHPWSVGQNWQAVEAVAQSEGNVLSLIERNARLHGQKTAIVCDEVSLSFAELNAAANRLARLLAGEYHLTGSPRMAIYMSRSIDRVVAVLACLKLGGAYVPLSKELPLARLAMILQDAEAAVVLSDMQSLDSAGVLSQITPMLVVDEPEVQNRMAQHTDTDLTGIEISDDSLSHLIFTSGSTGRPKGVMGNHGALFNRVQWMLKRYPFDTDEVACHITSMAFIRGVWELFVPLCAGVPMVLVERDVVKDPQRFVATLESHRISRMVSAPSLMRAMDAYLSATELQLACLKLWFVSGEALSSELALKMVKRLKQTRLVNLYGSTEVMSDVLYYPVSGDEQSQYIPLGRAIDNMAYTIVDSGLNPVPAGVPGELVVVGKNVTQGYVGLAELTAKVFIETPAGRGYRTGDLVRQNGQDQLQYLGRIDHQLKIRGYRVELSEIEHYLSQLHFVKDVVVVACGQQEVALAAYLTIKPGSNIDAKDLPGLVKAELATELPQYMVPAAIIALAEMPLTPNGKINRKALPAVEALLHSEVYAAPVNPVEQQLAAIWADTLDLNSPDISRDADFFALGGHSLLSIKLIANVRSGFNVEISIVDVFAEPRLCAMAGLIAAKPKLDSAGDIVRGDDTKGQVAASFSQKRMWFLHQMDGGNAHYNIPLAFRVEGHFDTSIAEQAIAAIVAHQPVLRTVYGCDDDGQVYQLVRDELRVEFEHDDLSGLCQSAQQQQLKELVDRHRTKVFDLTSDCMLKAGFIRLSSSQGVLVFNVHHIAADGWSTRLIVQSFCELYSAALSGGAASLPQLPVQYSDYAHWQHHWFSDNVLPKQLKFWQQQLKDLPVVHNLPLARPRPQYQSYRGANYQSVIDNRLLSELRLMAKAHGISLFMLLHGAFSLVLSRFSGEQDIVVGTPVANRKQQVLNTLVGFFVNTVVLRAACAGGQTVKDYLEQVKQVNLDALAHQDMPFEYLVDQLQATRTTAHSPLFQIMLSMDNNTQVDVTLPDVDISPVQSDVVTAKFDLSLNLIEQDAGLICDFEYNTDLFDLSQIQSLAESTHVLLQSLVQSDEHTTVDELELLNAKTRDFLCDELNPQIPAHYQTAAVAQLFSAQAKRTGQQIAVSCNGQLLTYAQLEARANNLGGYLQQQGCAPGDLVALCVNRSEQMIVALLAILKCGAAYLPLDPTYPKARLAHMMKDSNAKWLLTQSAVSGLVEHDADKTLLIDALEWNRSSFKEVIDSKDSSLAYMIYTSGSTGLPKGVMVEQQSLSRHIQAMVKYLDLGLNDGVLQFASMSFDTFIEHTFASLCSGATLHLRDDSLWSVEHFYGYCDEHGITVTDLSPAYLNSLLSDDNAQSYWANSSLQKVVVGGEALPNALLQRWQRQVGSQCRLFNAYGPTEATITSSIAELTGDTREVSIGRPFGQRSFYVFDEQQKLVPFGAVGELYIGGEHLARGYHGQSELTAERFIDYPFDDGRAERLYRTGDLVRYGVDNQLYFVGRADEQIKIRGYRIEPGEIETALMDIDKIQSAVVISHELNGQSILAAYLVSESEVMTAQIKRELAVRLPAYMVPTSIMVLEQLPLMPNGKVDKAALPAPGLDVSDLTYRAPQTEMEQKLVAIWAALLQLQPQDLSVDGNFFSLGGDSILSLSLVAKAKKHGINISVKDILENQTIAALAQVAQTNVVVEAPQGPVEGEMPLLPVQRDFFADSTDLNHYNHSVLLKLDDALSRTQLKAIVSALFSRHDALRIRFTATADDWQAKHVALNETLVEQSIKNYELPEDDFSTLPVIAEQAQLSLSLTDGPLCRVIQLSNQSDEVRLLVIVHHLLVDGVSWRVLLADLDSLCSLSQQHKPLTLEQKTSSCQQWGQYLQSYSQSEALLSERQYWLDALQIERREQLYQGMGSDRYVMASESLSLTKSQTKKLKQAAKNTQINELLLCAVWSGIAQWSGKADLLVDLEGHGRELLGSGLDLSQTVGWFTSIYPLRLSRVDGVTALEGVCEAIRGIPNKGIGFGVLKHLVKDEQLAALPASSLLFNYLGQFDQLTGQMAALSIAQEQSGTAMSPNRKPSHELTVNALVSKGQLQFELSYNGAEHSQGHIALLLEKIKAELLALIEEPVQTTEVPVAEQGLTDCLIRLNSSESEHKLFCLHPLGGTVSAYAPLAEQLADVVSVYGVEAAPLHSTHRFTDLGSLAGYYYRAIKALQPEGPYRLLGWSLGGSVAYELARQMVEASDEVECLALLDEAPVEAKASGSWYERIKGLFEAQFAWDEVTAQTQAKGIELLVAQAMTNGFAPNGVDAGQMQRYFQYLVDTSAALARYQVQPACVDLTLFKVKHKVSSNNPLPDYGWGNLALGQVSVITAQGDHEDMVKPPYSESLAQSIKQNLLVK